MGSDAEFTIVGGPEGLAGECVQLGARLEQLWTRFSAESELSRLSAGEAVVVDDATRALLDRMQRATALTEGAFNPTLLREVIELGYGHSLNSSALSARPAVPAGTASIMDINIAETGLQLPRGLAVDAGGIGKGFAADLVREFAERRGARGVLASFGGDLVVWGTPPDGTDWRIDVDDATAPGTALQRIRLSAGAMTTSSQVKRRFSSLGGERSHLVHPFTRGPVADDVVAVTVIAGEGWFAEACTKPGFVWPLAEYLRWLPTVNAAALVLTADRAVHTSANWGSYA